MTSNSPSPSMSEAQTSTILPDSRCPFCAIASAFPPQSPMNPSSEDWDPEKLDPPSYVILSTPDVVAFLDIAPLTRGHVLVAPRRHRVKMGDAGVKEAAELGRLLPLIARSVLRAVLPDVLISDADYNIVQNNGHRAAQVVPHIHFHIIPRPPDNYQSPNHKPSNPYIPPAYQTANARQTSYVMFGRGMRTELDDDDAVILAKEMRDRVQEEVQRVQREEGIELFSEKVGWRSGAAGGGKL